MGSRMTGSALMLGILVLSLGLAVACGQGKGSSSAEEFYRGKTITWIAASDVGSGTDILSRAIAPYLAKEIGATVRVENTDPNEGPNYVYAQGPRDGLVLAVKSTGALISNDILKAPGTQYETEKFNFIADVNPTAQTMGLSPKLSHRTLDALRQAKGLKAGGTSAKGALAIGGAVVFEVLGLDGKVVTGYQGTGALKLAMARGEVDIAVQSDNSAKKDEEDGNIVNFAILNEQRSKAVPHVPTIIELGVKVAKELEAPLEYVRMAGQSLVAPPEVPQERIEYLRKVLEKLSADQNLQNDMMNLTGAPNPFLTGKELQARVATIKANKALAEQLDAIFNKYTAVQ